MADQYCAHSFARNCPSWISRRAVSISTDLAMNKEIICKLVSPWQWLGRTRMIKTGQLKFKVKTYTSKEQHSRLEVFASLYKGWWPRVMYRCAPQENNLIIWYMNPFSKGLLFKGRIFSRGWGGGEQILSMKSSHFEKGGKCIELSCQNNFSWRHINSP